ncbi:hypothetical protein [Nocardioides litoris]|uniref:hypothetical protein n=1 Tax=Nocardioides litoris TaxID=1926648 RepID=UPI00111CA8D5|nr:hypothetical protein [Nocardioides litoris]
MSDPTDRPDGPDGAGERRAWGWVASLRAGGTTPWADWRDEAERGSRFLPGAQQLELLRRVNLLGRPGPALVERVLAASAPGRGRPDLLLAGASRPTSYGPRPVDPGDLPATELLRVATNLIAEDVVAAGLPEVQVPRLNRPWRPYEVAGVRWLAGPVRDQMVRRGRRPGGRGFVATIVGADVATMVELAWVSRCFDEGGPDWSSWIGGATRRPTPPPRADLPDMAATWAGGLGAHRVQVVLDHDRLPYALGTRRALAPAPVPSADAAELARWVTAPLGLLVLPQEQAELLRRTLLPWLLRHPGPPVRLDVEQRAWAADLAGRMARTLRDAEYAVLGSTDLLVPAPAARTQGSAGPDDDRVLELAVRLLLERGERTTGAAVARR